MSYYSAGPPLKPTLSFNQTTSPPTICFDTYSFYVITSYEINITDVTNDTLVNRMTVNVSRGCIPLTPVLYPPQCSPYQVSVKAFNRVGASPVNVTKAGKYYCTDSIILIHNII